MLLSAFLLTVLCAASPAQFFDREVAVIYSARNLIARPNDLAVVVPTYNEAPNIGPLLERVEAARLTAPFEVLIVDDNSPDGTGALVQARRIGRPWLHLIQREAPLGLGSAYQAGFSWALGNGYGFVGEMDADLSHDPAVIPELLAAARDGADLALGSRYVSGGATVGWPLRRRLLSQAANVFARTLLRLHVRDVTGGFRVYSRRAIELLIAGASECAGYGFQVEGVHAMVQAGFSVVEVPITFRDREFGSSKMSAATAIEAARRCVALALRGNASPTEGRTADPHLAGADRDL